MRAETRHCNFVAGHSICTLEKNTNLVLLNSEPVYSLQTNFFLKVFFLTASIFGQRGILSLVSYDFCTWKYYLKTAFSRLF